MILTKSSSCTGMNVSKAASHFFDLVLLLIVVVFIDAFEKLFLSFRIENRLPSKFVNPSREPIFPPLANAQEISITASIRLGLKPGVSKPIYPPPFNNIEKVR